MNAFRASERVLIRTFCTGLEDARKEGGVVFV